VPFKALDRVFSSIRLAIKLALFFIDIFKKSVYMQKANNKIIKFLQQNNLTLALAESMTCGLAAHQLSVVKGTSEVLIGSIVAYNGNVKTKLLHIPNALIKKFTAESQQVTDAMVKGLKKVISADVYVAITGLASHGGSETANKPVGTVFFSVLFKNKLFTKRNLFRGTPMAIKKKTCDELYRFIISSISTLV
jgi:nicotinamide-nucleotide amidase